MVERAFTWQTASYNDWNERLLGHVLGRSDGSAEDDTSCARVPATPEEACRMLGVDEALGDAVVAKIAERVGQELQHENCAFLRYCLNYRLGERTWWSPDGDGPPYFFAALWLLCLVGYGHFRDPTPGARNSFADRLERALPGRTTALTPIAGLGLDDVWEDLARWAKRQHRAEPGAWRMLELPDRCPFRRNIGRPHFLAFPHVFDREKLSRALFEENLVGVEPPVRAVLDALLTRRKQFSQEFQEDLENLLTAYLKRGRDPRESPFWRAVRREALRPTFVPPEASPPSRSGLALFVEWDEDGVLSPFLAGRSAAVDAALGPPSNLEFPIDGFTHRFMCDDRALNAELSAGRSRVRPADIRAVRDGVIPLYEVATGMFRVAVGPELGAATVALVRDDLLDAFVRDFGRPRRIDESGWDRWRMADGVRIRPSDELGPEFRAARSLMPSDSAPPPIPVGGVRTEWGSFIAYPGFLPRIRAVGARAVEAAWAGMRVSCVQDAEDASRWLLPSALGEVGCILSVRVTAHYEVSILESRVACATTCELALRPWTVALRAKGVPTGQFQVETTDRQSRNLIGPCEEVPLELADAEAAVILDALPFDRTARWLGSRVGEMSVERRANLPWLVTGPKNHPETLTLVAADCSTAPRPTEGCSPDSGDRRHWKSAFNAPHVAWKRGNTYLTTDSWGTDAADLLRAYRSRLSARVEGGAQPRSVPATRLDTHFSDAPWGEPWDQERRGPFNEVLAQLVANRAGLPLRELHEVLAACIPNGEDHELREQLVRSLAESGALDVLRRADGRQRVVIGRLPRLVCFREGSRWRASLFGVAPTSLRRALRDAVVSLKGAVVEVQRCANTLLPDVLRVRVLHRSDLVTLSRDVELAAPLFVGWGEDEAPPEALRIRGELATDIPPEAYTTEAWWNWNERRFTRFRAPHEHRVELERRRDRLRTPIFVVRHGDETIAWSYSRTWALVAAYEAASMPFLREVRRGYYEIQGRSPLHIPLPLARLCTLVGAGAPGPRLGRDGHVEAYCYPFGAQLRRVIDPLLPPAWLEPPPP